MVSKVALVFAVICVCQVFGKPSGEPDNIQALTTQVQTVFDTFHEEFKKVFDIKENDEQKKIADNLKTGANEFAGRLNKILSHVSTETKAHSNEAATAVDALKTKVSETVKKLQEDHPAEAAKAKEYQKQIETTYNELYTKAKEAAQAIAKDTSGIQEDMSKFTENIIKEVKTQAEKVNAELKKSLDAHKGKH